MLTNSNLCLSSRFVKIQIVSFGTSTAKVLKRRDRNRHFLSAPQSKTEWEFYYTKLALAVIGERITLNSYCMLLNASSGITKSSGHGGTKYCACLWIIINIEQSMVCAVCAYNTATVAAAVCRCRALPSPLSHSTCIAFHSISAFVQRIRNLKVKKNM